MHKFQKSLKNLILSDDRLNSSLFSKKSIVSIARCILEPLANENVPSMVFHRLKNPEGLEGIIKRLEYSRNIEMYNFLDPDIVIKDDLVELEFILLTSSRYNAVFMWDYSDDVKKEVSQIYFVLNSKNVNQVFELLMENSKQNLSEKFYSFKPERRENELLNSCVANILKNFNEAVSENDFKDRALSFEPKDDCSELKDKIRHTSHEIRNQLSVLDIYSKILEKKFSDDKTSSLIRKSISLIAMELNELKQFENLDLREMLIEDVIPYSINMFEEIVKQNNNKIIFVNSTIEGDKRKVMIDEGKFLSVLNNVIKNANQFTQNDEIIVELSKDDSNAKISIQNHGEPIDEETKTKIFKDGFTTRKEGFGIGLSVCRKYLAEQLGSIELTASDEEKTEFLIKLPLIDIV